MGKRGGTIPSLKLVSSFDTILKYILGERERERERGKHIEVNMVWLDSLRQHLKPLSGYIVLNCIIL